MLNGMKVKHIFNMIIFLGVIKFTCSTGRQKAPVFPDPVSAAMRTSPPPKIRGMASAWTSVGNLNYMIVKTL
jgi:hypothetical protein